MCAFLVVVVVVGETRSGCILIFRMRMCATHSRARALSHATEKHMINRIKRTNNYASAVIVQWHVDKIANGRLRAVTGYNNYNNLTQKIDIKDRVCVCVRVVHT